MAQPCHLIADQVYVQFTRTGMATLENVSLHCPAGQFLAIVGPSGCGKSTLLRCFAGLQKVNRGAIRYDSTQQQPPRVAFVFQDPNLLPWRTVWQNIALPLELAGGSRKTFRDAAYRTLPLIGLTEQDAEKFPAQLSGGMRMRVSLARALVTQPDILLLDEPFAALDEISRQQLNDELQRLWADQHWTTLFVTHHVAEAVYLSERVVVMASRPGRILDDVTIQAASPRQMSWRADAAFVQYCFTISQRLREASA